MSSTLPPPPKLFLSTMLYAAAKRLGYQEASQELFRQVTKLDPTSDSSGIPAAVTLARAAALEPATLNVNAGATVIGKARSLAAAEFLASDADVWLSVDDDVVVSQDALVPLIEQCRVEPCLAVVPCLLRNSSSAPNPKPVINLVAGAVALQAQLGPYKLESVDAGGFGCFAVSRAVVAAAAELVGAAGDFLHDGRLFRRLFFDELIDRHWVTEDLAFCRRVRELGFRLWAVRTGYSIHAGQRLDLATLEALIPSGGAGGGSNSGGRGPLTLA
jgi:cellulose synthase/poly-beta-1,6-N-acetylglucosamine synthase-like glycosyltransferase